MKIYRIKSFTAGTLLILGSIVTILYFCSGCATPITRPGTPAIIQTQVTPAQPAQTIQQIVPEVPASATNGAVLAITNYIVLPALPAVTNYVTVQTAMPPVITSYVPNSAVMQGVTYAQEAGPLVPAPYGTILTGVASLVACIASYIATKKNAQLTASTTANQTLAAVVAPSATLTSEAMRIAASNGSTAAVATHIANANAPT